VSATRLLVLGVVRKHGKAHGYQVRRELLTWSADKWANVAPGSIYHALKQMAKEGLLEQVELEPGVAGPERTGYRLTADGEAEFLMLLGKSLAESDPDAAGQYTFCAAFTFLTALPRHNAISLLRHRATRLTGHRATMRDVLEGGADWGQPAHVNELLRLTVACIDATIGWTEDLIERLEAGEYVMADDSPDHFGACPVVIKLD
jgi:DNA-binding PadR family transcriptional regulator